MDSDFFGLQIDGQESSAKISAQIRQRGSKELPNTLFLINIRVNVQRIFVTCYTAALNSENNENTLENMDILTRKLL